MRHKCKHAHIGSREDFQICISVPLSFLVSSYTIGLTYGTNKKSSKFTLLLNIFIDIIIEINGNIFLNSSLHYLSISSYLRSCLLVS